jgi:aminopeptidase N
MSTEVKQEGSFKIKKKTPKKLVAEKEVTKVDLTKKEENNAISTQAANDSDVAVKKSEDSQDGKGVVEEIRPAEKTVENTEENTDTPEAKEESPIELIEDEKNNTEQAGVEPSDEVASTTPKQKEVLQENKTQELPENIEKLIKFMEDTGGSIEDYARLNTDYSNVDNNSLIREFYRQTKPHLDNEDVNLILEEFNFDKEIDEPKDIRKKQPI